jgi:hypothetical protein
MRRDRRREQLIFSYHPPHIVEGDLKQELFCSIVAALVQLTLPFSLLDSIKMRMLSIAAGALFATSAIAHSASLSSRQSVPAKRLGHCVGVA